MRTHHRPNRSFKDFVLHLVGLWVWTLKAISLVLYLFIAFIIAAFRDWKHDPAQWSNCAIYAFCQEYNEGGRIVMARSHYGWWYHIQWIPPSNDYVYDFNPTGKKRPMWYPPIVFKGRVRRRRIRP